ncbi:conserved putative membrane protein [Maudiozyma exigua]|uniref:Conserved putative membrane protein n=1 Tax=Maudiozyma exigua TaxID=34358 RepID=A0A9P6W1D6_MAUEX|nr:conserved putative membrane protein [Kazachstania exigua]
MNFYDALEELLEENKDKRNYSSRTESNKNYLLSPDSSQRKQSEAIDIYSNDMGYLSDYPLLSTDDIDISLCNILQYDSSGVPDIGEFPKLEPMESNLSFGSDISLKDKNSNFNSPISVYSNNNGLSKSKTEDIFVYDTQNTTKSALPISSALHHMSVLTNIVTQNTKKHETMTLAPTVKKQTSNSVTDVLHLGHISNSEMNSVDIINSSKRAITKVGKQSIGRNSKRKATMSFSRKSMYDKSLTNMLKRNKVFRSKGNLLTPTSPIDYTSSQDNETSLAETIKNDKDLYPIATEKHKRGSHRCNHCPEKFSTILEYAEHMDEFNIRRKYKCPFSYCPWKILGLPGRSDLRRHCAIKHKDDLDDCLRNSLNLRGDIYTTIPCPHPYCKKIFRRKDAYKRHVNIVHSKSDSRFNKRLTGILENHPEKFESEESKRAYIMEEMSRGRKK